MNRRRKTRQKGDDHIPTRQAAPSPSSLASRPTGAPSTSTPPTGGRRRTNPRRPVADMHNKDGAGNAIPEDQSDNSNNSSHCAESAARAKRSRLVMWGLVGVVGIAAAAVLVPLLLKARPETNATSAASTAVPSPPQPSQQKPPNDTLYASIGSYELLETVPHDPEAFTQGLCLLNATHCYESTGLHGRSSIRVVEIASGRVTLQQDVPSRFFGEGLTSYYNAETGRMELVQLTWQEKTGLVYDALTLRRLRTFRYDTPSGEGWGITTCPPLSSGAPPAAAFLVSDGSHYLTTWNASFHEVSSVAVTIVLPKSFLSGTGEQNEDEDKPMRQYLRNLNELEYDPHTGTVLSNVWFKDWVVRINVTTGIVLALYELADLYPPGERDPGTDVLNGIAVTDDPGVVWVTGKLWPYMYKIRLVDP